MATTTKIVIGRPRDGEVSTTAGTLAKKINDITTGATNIYSVTIAKKGSSIVAVIVYN
jgi:hypothetical protein